MTGWGPAYSVGYIQKVNAAGLKQWVVIWLWKAPVGMCDCVGG